MSAFDAAKAEVLRTLQAEGLDDAAVKRCSAAIASMCAAAVRRDRTRTAVKSSTAQMEQMMSTIFPGYKGRNS